MKFKIAIISMIVAFVASSQAMEICSGESNEQVIDLRNEPLSDSVDVSYNSSWIGGDSSAEVVISDNGTEIKRTTGEGDFTWSPVTAGKHTLTYTTYINGVAQDDVYTATVYADWKYTIEDGKATIVETTQKSGSVTIPSKIDGFPVVGFGDGLFAGSENITIVAMPGNLVTKMSDIFLDSYDKLTSVTLTGDVTEIPQDAFAGCVALGSFIRNNCKL